MRKNNIKVQIEKYSALGLSLALAVSGLAGCGAAQAAQLSQTETAAEESQETEAPEEEAITAAETARTLTSSGTGSQDREETVYVVANADGSAKDEISSVWLKNPDGEDVLTDDVSLSDVENVKGDETYTTDQDGNLVWQAGGNDIYYQGRTDKELPVTTQITYTLDGKQMQPDQLAGKNGHLDMLQAVIVIACDSPGMGLKIFHMVFQNIRKGKNISPLYTVDHVGAEEEKPFFYRGPCQKILPPCLGSYVHLERQCGRTLLPGSESNQPAFPDC